MCLQVWKNGCKLAVNNWKLCPGAFQCDSEGNGVEGATHWDVPVAVPVAVFYNQSNLIFFFLRSLKAPAF